MSKQDIEVAQAVNPDANFSISMIYSILTKGEFAEQIKNSLKIRNSWSDSWGDGGYIRLKRAFSRAVRWSRWCP
ncbi:hypothetical protein BBO99_00007724 [Phytophthora kernoviae]|uniref:Peptidase C1A papain C-terminal domain-containing protein n=2 Tax=Phytophthora kernoviae TaxID=325452 RepID=A0A3R7NC51_9STRA|nr:hypothetical protein G195_008822 [Phytophthora kernoviae 00238/432]KAG2518172.1 hypothetical protein JM16_007389 [Phytophthora kernoviae]KAG2519973.1 hypothetical protein JM18_007367 [Phytophthora kernoviae]RLN05751.1 hypothetical protein BBI17_007655 [Phytophthora kernoviae]RLN76226.1 hypothetical protein BBO99_00007724 [Phytophthora kernoviae]